MLVKLLNLNIGNAETSQLNILDNQSHLFVHSYWFYNDECAIEKLVKVNLSELVCKADYLELPCINS